MNRKAIHGIDIFAGAGGLSLGAELAGVKVTHAIESHPAAAATYRFNHPETIVIEKDVRFVEPFDGPRRRPLVLFGGPPCQGFSTSNQRTRTIRNPKNWLFGEFFRFACALKPDWIVLENVKGLRETAKGHFERLIQSEFEAMDYTFALWTMCAVDFGVPQRRSRLFFVGRRRGKIPPAPSSTSGNPVTVRQAISDLPPLKVGSNIDELDYRQNPFSAYARQMRQGLKRCTGHLVASKHVIEPD